VNQSEDKASMEEPKSVSGENNQKQINGQKNGGGGADGGFVIRVQGRKKFGGTIF